MSKEIGSDSNETLARDHQIGQQWFPIVQLNADDERFFDKHEEATPQAVLSFYVIDDTNPSSIRATVRMARENARSLHHLISTNPMHSVSRSAMHLKTCPISAVRGIGTILIRVIWSTRGRATSRAYQAVGKSRPWTCS